VKGSQNGVSGLEIYGAFRRTGGNQYQLCLKFINRTGRDLSDFLLKINNNFYGIQPIS
jgi:hypothetical protein